MTRIVLPIKNSALSEDRTHDLQIALSFVIMRLTRYLLRYQGTQISLLRWPSPNQLATDTCEYFCR